MASKKDNPLTEKEMVQLLRKKAQKYLSLPNVSSVGVGFKIKDKRKTDKLCIQFTVEKKLSPMALESEGLTLLPETIVDDDKSIKVPVDVLERSYKPSFEWVCKKSSTKEDGELTFQQKRRKRLETIQPGISLSHVDGTAGTFGAVVYDNQTDQPYILSNWHVLNGPTGNIGDTIVQPGPYDDSDTADNHVGELVRSHLGLAGDCAIASIMGRDFEDEILELNVVPCQVAKAALGDHVVKSGRTTGVTYGIVKRVGVVVKINYGGEVGVQQSGGFEIGPNPEKPSPNGEVSMGGDSGSLWLIDGKKSDNGSSASDIAVGLHFAGETDPSPDAEHALACNIHSVLEKLEVSLEEKDPEIVEDEDLWNEVMARLDLMSMRIQALETQRIAPVAGGEEDGAPGQPQEARAPVMAAMQEGIPVYGNWCGPGHGGGLPIDDVDRACMRHDQCYDKKGYFDCRCDAQLLRDLDRALVSGKVKAKGRVMGPIIRAWFTGQPCVYHTKVFGKNIPIAPSTGGVANVTSYVGSGVTTGVKAVKKGAKKVWKKIKSWF